VAFVVHYADGLQATLLNLNGYVQDFAFAARVPSLPTRLPQGERGTVETAPSSVVATAFKLEGKPPRWHFNFLAHHIQQFFVTHQAPYPVERTVLTSGILAALMDAGFQGQQLDTPHLAISYQPPEQPWARSHGTSLPPDQVWGFGPEQV
jgi:hypothetical protein